MTDIEMTLKVERIGSIEKGIDGTDAYLLVTSNEGALDCDQVEAFLLQQWWRDSSGPGTYYCNSVRVIPDPVHDNECIAIVQHRYDV